MEKTIHPNDNLSISIESRKASIEDTIEAHKKGVNAFPDEIKFLPEELKLKHARIYNQEFATIITKKEDGTENRTNILVSATMCGHPNNDFEKDLEIFQIKLNYESY